MRIVSLLPAATEIVFALGLGDELVGRSSDCDHPAEALEVPVVAWSIDDPAGPDTTDSLPSALLEGTPDALARTSHRLVPAVLADARPDLILTQRLCRVCAVHVDQVERVVRDLGIDTTIVALEASTVEGVFNSISTVGAFAEAEDEAVGLLEILRHRLAAIEDRVLERRLAGIAPPRVVILEWISPPFSAGHWVPEMVRRAGGWDLLGVEGMPSVEITWERLREVDPERVILAPCGLDAAQAVAAFHEADVPAWVPELPAFAADRLVAVDGGGLLSRPGPRIVDGIGMLAEVFDPHGLDGAAPPGSWRRVAGASRERGR
ncbi:MAG: ABC transporter substrate-binding protein [Chloroflexi bacterium]|nr:ABC transporter substrate-binding protein [Chloroflexota bacterium]